MRVTVRQLAIGAALLVVVGLIVWVAMPGPIQVETAVVSKGRFVASVQEDGKTGSASAMSWPPRLPAG